MNAHYRHNQPEPLVLRYPLNVPRTVAKVAFQVATMESHKKWGAVEPTKIVLTAQPPPLDLPSRARSVRDAYLHEVEVRLHNASRDHQSRRELPQPVKNWTEIGMFGYRFGAERVLEIALARGFYRVDGTVENDPQLDAELLEGEIRRFLEWAARNDSQLSGRLHTLQKDIDRNLKPIGWLYTLREVLDDLRSLRRRAASVDFDRDRDLLHHCSSTREHGVAKGR